MTIQNNVHSFDKHPLRLKRMSSNEDTMFAQNDGVQFLEDARRVAEKHNCRFLFEFPPSLIDPKWAKAAAILCPGADGYQLNFLLFRSEDREISVVESSDVPIALVNFACSFAKILSVLPNPEKQLIQ